MTDLQALIADLERAEDGSPDLDLRLGKAVGEIPESAVFDWIDPEDGSLCWVSPGPAEVPESEMRGYRDTGNYGRPSYRIDDALLLVPEGWDEEIRRARHRKGWFASLSLYRPGIGYDGTTRNGDAPTPALALCVAAMKARAADG